MLIAVGAVPFLGKEGKSSRLTGSLLRITRASRTTRTLGSRPESVRHRRWLGGCVGDAATEDGASLALGALLLDLCSGPGGLRVLVHRKSASDGSVSMSLD